MLISLLAAALFSTASALSSFFCSFCSFLCFETGSFFSLEAFSSVWLLFKSSAAALVVDEKADDVANCGSTFVDENADPDSD